MRFKLFITAFICCSVLCACKANHTPEQSNKNENGVELIKDAFAEGKALECPPDTQRIEKMDSNYPEFFCIGRNGRVGTWLEYDRYGRLIKRTTYKNDKINGEWIEYHENGKINLQGTIVDNNRVGEWTQWYITGEKRSVKHFENNVIHGKTTIYYKNGKIMGEGMFVDNFEEGIWKLYTPEGKLARECNFEHGDEKDCIVHIKDFKPKSQTFGEGKKLTVTEDS